MADDKTARGTGNRSKAGSGQRAGRSAGTKGTSDKAATGKSGTARSGTRPKAVKPPTIDLKAEEVRAEQGAAASGETQASAGKDAKPAASSGSATEQEAPKMDTKPQASNSGASQTKPAKQGNGRLGMVGYVGAGAVGAVAAAAVSLGMNTIGVRTPDTSALETRIEQLAAQSSDSTALQQQIDVLQARQSQLTEQVGAASAGGEPAALANLQATLESSITETQNELARLSGDIETLSAQGTGEAATAMAAEIEALANRLNGAEGRLDQVATSEDLAALQIVIAEATGSEGEPGAGLSVLAELGQAVSDRNDALATRINALEPAMQGLAETVTTLESRIAESLGTGASMSDIEGLGDRIASIGGQFDDLRNAIAGAQAKADATEQLLADYESRLTSAESGLANLQNMIGAAQDRASSGATSEAATALAAAQLQDAVQRGGSYAAPLQTLTTLLGDDRPEISILTAHAENGVPTVTDLAARFEGLAGDMVAAGSVREDAGILGRLVDNARGIVSVRPVSPVSGETPAAIVSRISGHLAESNLDAARSEWNQLPQAARSAAADWGDQLAARVDVDAALATLTASLLTDLRNAAGTAPATQ